LRYYSSFVAYYNVIVLLYVLVCNDSITDNVAAGPTVPQEPDNGSLNDGTVRLIVSGVSTGVEFLRMNAIIGRGTSSTMNFYETDESKIMLVHVNAEAVGSEDVRVEVLLRIVTEGSTPSTPERRVSRRFMLSKPSRVSFVELGFRFHILL
jgi:hypothetical protein